MEYIWNNIIFSNDELNINENELSNYSLLMTERYATPYKLREKLLNLYLKMCQFHHYIYEIQVHYHFMEQVEQKKLY